MVEMMKVLEPSSPKTVVMVSSLSDLNLVGKNVSSANVLSSETQPILREDQHGTPLSKPQPPATAAHTSPPTVSPIRRSADSNTPDQSLNHPLLASPPSGRASSRHSGSSNGPVRRQSSGSLSRVPLPPRGSGSGWRLTAAASSPKSPSHRRASSMGDGRGVRTEALDTAKGLDELKAVLEEKKKKYGDRHPQVGLVHNSIGNLHFRNGDLVSAETSYGSALQCFKSTTFDSRDEFYDSDSSLVSFGSGRSSFAELQQDLDIAAALCNIGAVMWSTGKLADAIEHLNEGIRMRTRVRAIRAESGVVPSDKEVADMSSALYSLGLAHSLQGDYDEAMGVLNRAQEELSEGEANFARSVEMARIDDARGKIHLLRGDASSSLRCHLRALEAKSSVLASSHPSVVATRINLAATYRAMGELDEALALYYEVLSVQKASLYRTRDEETRRRTTADIGVTVRMISEAQSQVKSIRRVSSTADIMAAIVE